eukprot:TRINITY_DN23775_c0_g1_i1.p1 TRINITY_DN23775_c0_g1~~TRINITY_DN23775_c0_g1_i1.p1  ORF type:complete len:311 (+),score=62.30 TRINITY_DN23775_c0_g1_i1:99-1031(+)
MTQACASTNSIFGRAASVSSTLAVGLLAASVAAVLGFAAGARSATRRKGTESTINAGKVTKAGQATRKRVGTVTRRKDQTEEEHLLARGAENAKILETLLPPPSCARERSGLCECGVRIPKEMSEEEVKTHMTSTRHVRNLLALGGSSEVVVCEEVGEYRAAAQQLVHSKDCVLEVGCHVGGTTKVLATTAGHLVGFDQQSDLVAEARRRRPDIRFEVGDAFDAPRVLALAREQELKRFTKVFVDISGSRDISTVVRLLDIYENTLKPEILVVKSQALKRLLLRSRLWVEHPECCRIHGDRLGNGGVERA